MQIGATEHPVADRFVAELATRTAPNVLEVGTMRQQVDFPTHHRAWAPDDSLYIMGDIEAGLDVDLIVDAHNLSPWFLDGGTDAFIAVAVWEHLHWPWVAAREVTRILRSGGIAYVQTHMAFPEHGYPSDYTRWTADGLTELFAWAGMETVDVSHTYPCQIVPPPDVASGRWNPGAPAWLCVDWYGRKP